MFYINDVVQRISCNFYYNPFSESIKYLIFNNTFRLLISEKVDSIEINSMYQIQDFTESNVFFPYYSLRPLNQESRKEYFQSVGGEKVSLMVLETTISSN